MTSKLPRAVLAMMLFAGAAFATAQQTDRAVVPVPDSQLGLSKTNVLEAPVPERYVYPETSPGESERFPRRTDGGPPLIPHSLDGLLPITHDSNACVACHGTPGPASDVPPPAPASHFVDQRNAPDVVRTEIAGARWVCTACHVPQTDAPALAGSSAR